ncbi:MAG: hypothetical protein H6621_10205 [Halobacteriovoraceae bacterium]|nr:hypothetical protein [Halobacteriovoraceae bacterium]MCB9095428.1 hypothetical protein [Halobacteriovoraceae bacterium]
MSLRVQRIVNSPYFASNFGPLEEKAIREKGWEYCCGPDRDFKANVLITNTHCTPEMLKDCWGAQLELIVHPNSGYDNFSLSFIQECPCPIVLGNAIRMLPVTEYILGSLWSAFAIKRQTVWNRDPAVSNRKLLAQSKVLIIGKGHIGKCVEQKLRDAVELIEFVDPYENSSKKLEEIELSDFDGIILAASLNSKNAHLVDKSFLDQLKKDVVLINAARGGLMDWEALVNFVVANPRAQAFLDVFENEPLELEKYSHIPNLSLTSHIAGCYDKLDQEIIRYEIQVIEDFQNLAREDFLKKYSDVILQNRIVNDFIV